MKADPESIPANNLTHKFSKSYAHAGVDSGSALELGPKVFAGAEDVSGVPSCWRPPGMTGLGTVGLSYEVK